jgi:predicted nucleic acid-binding protein
VVVVSDSSPLILLSRVGSARLLPALFGEVVIPAVVREEVVTARPGALGLADVRDASWLIVDGRSLPEVDLGLDLGETGAILLAEELGADLLLIDERAGRRVASDRGLAIRGTLGVLVQARQTDILPELRPVLTALIEQGFRLAPPLVAEALRRVGER